MKGTQRRSAQAGVGQSAGFRRLRGCGRDAVQTQAGALQIRRAIPNIGDFLEGLDEALPVVASARRRRYARERRDRVGGLRRMIEHPLRGGGPYAGQQMQYPEPGESIARIASTKITSMARLI